MCIKQIADKLHLSDNTLTINVHAPKKGGDVGTSLCASCSLVNTSKPL